MRAQGAANTCRLLRVGLANIAECDGALLLPRLDACCHKQQPRYIWYHHNIERPSAELCSLVHVHTTAALLTSVSYFSVLTAETWTCAQGLIQWVLTITADLARLLSDGT